MVYLYPRRLYGIFTLNILLLILMAMNTGCNNTTGTDKNAPILVVDTTTLYFGTLLTEKTFSITNSNTNEGAKKLDWMVSSDERFTWCTISPDAGAGDATVTVKVDRRGLSEGEHLTSLSVRSNGGTITIKVYVVVEK
ncbi:MAG: BACON domain-containing protein [Candidatus Latescibacteria bacterium]|nr:BACON domain-containing protein [Candidatus Latescibacterota bacterium]